MQLSSEELSAGRLSSPTLRSAVDQVRNNGYVVFERVLPPELVADMHARFNHLLEEHVARTDPNRGANRYQMHVPFAPPFTDERVVCGGTRNTYLWVCGSSVSASGWWHCLQEGATDVGSASRFVGAGG